MKTTVKLLFCIVCLFFLGLDSSDENFAIDENTPIENPDEPGDIQPAPGLLCGMGDIPGEIGTEPTCNPVNDWWCDYRLACLGVAEAGYSHVFASPELSPLGFIQPWYEHFRSCEADLAAHKFEIHLWRTGQLVYQPPEPDLGCDIKTDFRDGPGNALWKPVSENTGRPVFLLPASYKGVRDIDVFSSSGEHIVSGSFRGCCPNGNRAHFDVPVSAGRLEDYAPITVRLDVDGVMECREVENPEDRID